MENVNTGALKSPEDYRDIPFAAGATTDKLPKSYHYDMKPFLPHWHQRKIGACVGHALAKAMQVYWYRKTGKLVNFSARFLYAYAKTMDFVPGEGTYPSLVAKIARTVGCATEDTCPNDTKLDHETYVYNRKLENFPQEAIEEAGKYKIPGYTFPNVKNTDEIRNAIKKHGPVALLIRIGEEWYTDKNGKKSWAKKDIAPLRTPKSVISGHEVVLFGWDDKHNSLFNSWSDDWADKGDNTFNYTDHLPWIIECIAIVELPPEVIDTVQKLPTKETFGHRFNVNLQHGMKGKEVEYLQTALMIEGLFDTKLYSDLLKKKELGYYGDITAKAVLAFQKKYKLINWYQEITYRGRYCHLSTRTKLNELYT